MAKQSGGNTAQRVEALVRPTVEGMGLRLWDVVFEKEGPDLSSRRGPTSPPAVRWVWRR